MERKAEGVSAGLKAGRLETQQRPACPHGPEGGKASCAGPHRHKEEFPALSLSVLGRPSTDWVRPTHIRTDRVLLNLWIPV